MSLLPIGQLFNVEKGVLQSSKCESGGYDFLTAGEEWKTHKSFSHECEALVFAAAASGSLGRTHYVNGKFTASDLCFILTPKNSIQYPIDLNFYHFVFNSLRNIIVTATTRGSSKPSINITNFSNYQIQYFDIDLQREWTKKLFNIREVNKNLFSEISHQQSLLNKLRQAILQDAVQGKLVKQDKNDEPASELLKRIKAEKEKLIAEGKIRKEKPQPPIKDEEKPFSLPKGWVWCRLAEITQSVSTGPFGTMVHKSDYVIDGIPLVNPTNMMGGKISTASIKTVSKETKERLLSYELHDGDVVLARRGDLGRCAIVTSNEEGWLCGTGSFYVRFGRLINRDYFIRYFSSSHSVKYLLSSSVGSTMNNLNHKILNSLLIPLPPQNEQSRIAKKIDSLFSNCDRLEKQNNLRGKHSVQLVQVVLKEAFEGT